jgi:hypothetical protein
MRLLALVKFVYEASSYQFMREYAATCVFSHYSSFHAACLHCPHTRDAALNESMPWHRLNQSMA